MAVIASEHNVLAIVEMVLDHICPCFISRRTDHVNRDVGFSPTISLNTVPRSDVFYGNSPRIPPSPMTTLSPQPSQSQELRLTLPQVLKLTNNFSPALKINDGFFLTYKAELPGRHIVAIKRFKKEDRDSLGAEFDREIALFKKIEHKNLVQIFGHISEADEKIIITEYLPNHTLREHLDGKYGIILDFGQRLEIAIDVAHGLTYLHSYTEQPIIHRDVKSSNILLTEAFRAKVANFGFAKVGPSDGDTSTVVTAVKGTAGYIDPEYLRTNFLTFKSDVYSYGILLLEILSARRPIEPDKVGNEKITVRWAVYKYNKGRVTEILDPNLREVIDGNILDKVFDLVFRCVAPSRVDRPTMQQVVEELWKIRVEYSKSQHR